MGDWLQLIIAVNGVVNLIFILRIIFNDLRHLDDKIDKHIQWHLESK